MNKEVFLNALRERLSGFPQDDIGERISFYEEMIDDRIEEGMTEEEAVAAVGSIEDIAAQVMSEIPLSKIVMEKVKPSRKIKAWEIVLLVLGFPVWMPLLISAFAIVLWVYVTIWSIVIAVFAVDLSFGVCALASIPAAIIYLTRGNVLSALFMIGAGALLAGLAILLFFAGIWLSKTILILTKKMLLGIKSLFIGKGESYNE